MPTTIRRRPRLPTRTERRYTRGLLRLNAALARMARTALAPHLDRARRAERQDAELDVQSLGTDLGVLFLRMARLARRRAPLLVDQWGRDLDAENARDVGRVLRINPAEDSATVAAALQVARLDNVALIRSIPERMHADLRLLLAEAGASGMRVETLARRLEERYAVSASRATLIARDQTLKTNSALTRARHQEAGVVEYEWNASGDERVRDRHGELDGQIFRWDNPPVTNDSGERNHPGEDYQCRCIARPRL